MAKYYCNNKVLLYHGSIQYTCSLIIVLNKLLHVLVSNNTNNLNLVIIYSLLPAVYAWLKVSNGQETENSQSLNYDVNDKGMVLE